MAVIAAIPVQAVFCDGCSVDLRRPLPEQKTLYVDYDEARPNLPLPVSSRSEELVLTNEEVRLELRLVQVKPLPPPETCPCCGEADPVVLTDHPEHTRFCKSCNCGWIEDCRKK